MRQGLRGAYIYNEDFAGSIIYDLLPSSRSSAWLTASKTARMSSPRVVCLRGIGVGAFGLHKAHLCFWSP